MNQLVERWQQLLSRVDDLELRQRGLLFFGIVVMVYLVWAHLFMDPLDARRKTLSSQVSQVRAEIDNLNAQIGKLARSRVDDPNAPARERLVGLRAEAADLNERLEELTESLIPPKEMARVLESLLNRDTRLRLVRLEGLGFAPLVELTDSGDGDDASTVNASESALPGLYKHGLRMVFEGTYLDALELLRAVEELPWNFIWSRIALDVDEYPVSRVTVELYSLSFDEAWLEV